jgi:hypothetical protein
VTCPACQLDRDDCPHCAGVCTTCNGAGEVADNPGWPDPQCEERYECPTCQGDGMQPEPHKTYTELVLEHTRGDTAADNFDAEFDELLARQERMDEFAPQKGLLAPQFPPRTMTGGRLPYLPPVSEDDQRKAA